MSYKTQTYQIISLNFQLMVIKSIPIAMKIYLNPVIIFSD